MLENTGPRPSENAVQFFADALIAEEKTAAGERPKERRVALVGEAGTPTAAYIRDLGEPFLRGPQGSAALLVTRQDALDYLRRESPRMLDFLVDEGTGPRRTIPVIHEASLGFRSEGVGYDLAD